MLYVNFPGHQQHVFRLAIPLTTNKDMRYPFWEVCLQYYLCSTCRKHIVVLYLFMAFHRVCNQSNTMGATSEAGTAYRSGAPEFTRGFSSCSIFSFLCCVFVVVDHCLSFVLLLLAIALSVFLRFTDSDYPFGILKKPRRY